MTIYQAKSCWKLLLIVSAAIIVLASLYYTNQLAEKISEEERKKVQLVAEAYKILGQPNTDDDIGFVFSV
ncbi:MAG: sensor histidine kinase, partial [Planctomycetes bacterium]|nr:sensor histidine kinase [Planctomycetota bacterium]